MAFNSSTLFTQISQEKKDDVIDEEEDDIDYDDLENGKDEILTNLRWKSANASPKWSSMY